MILGNTNKHIWITIMILGNTNKHIWITIMILGQYKQAHLNHSYDFRAIQTSTFESQLWF